MADNFRLLFNAIASEGLASPDRVGIAAEGVAHEREIEAAALLSLPHMGHLVNEETLAQQRLAREIFGPSAGRGVEIDASIGRHRGIFRLKRPPFALDQPNLRIIDRIPENGAAERDLARRQRSRFHAQGVAAHGSPRHLRR